MAFGSFDNSERAPLAEINVVPLVDIMLVLLVIFIITAPVLTHAVRVDLPQATSTLNQEPPDAVTVSIDGQGKLFWNDQPVSEDELSRRLATTGAQTPQPPLNLRADKRTPYEVIARVMAAAHRNEVRAIGFVMEPEKP